MRRTTTRMRAAYLGTCTNQIGLNMSGNPSSIGRKGSLVRYIGKRVQANQKFCGVVTYQGQMWAKNTEPCVKKAPRGQSFNSGVGHIHSPRTSISKRRHKPTPKPPATTIDNNGGLWIEMPGIYQLGGSLYDPNQYKCSGVMKGWILNIHKFINTQDASGYPIKQIAMRLPAFTGGSKPPPYTWDASGEENWWNTMAFDHCADPSWNNLAKIPSVIFDLSGIGVDQQTWLDSHQHSLAWLAAQHTDIKWLWLPNTGDNFPFTGRNPIFPSSPDSPAWNTVTADGTWDNSYNLVHRGKDIQWDTNKMVNVVKYFQKQVYALTSATIKTGIIWEVEAMAYVWTIPSFAHPLPDGCPPNPVYSLDTLVDTCFTISKTEPGPLPKLMQTDNWTWGFTSYAKAGNGIKGLASSTIVWAAWNKINQLNSIQPNVALYVEWYGAVGKGVYDNTVSKGVLTALNEAKGSNTKAGATLMADLRFVEDPNGPFSSDPSDSDEYQTKPPMDYSQFTAYSNSYLLPLNNLWKNANYNYQFYNAVGIYKDVIDGSYPLDSYIPLISIEPYFMGGPPSKDVSGASDTTWKVKVGTDGSCNNYFPEKWPINVKVDDGAAMKSWVDEIGVTIDPSGYIFGPGPTKKQINSMYFAQTYTMEAFNGAAPPGSPLPDPPMKVNADGDPDFYYYPKGQHPPFTQQCT